MNFYTVTIETRTPGAIGVYEPRTYAVIATGRDAAAETAMHAAHADAWETRAPMSVTERKPDAVDTMARHYVIAALWSSLDDDGEPLECAYSPEDLAPAAWAAARSDCANFIESNQAELDALPESYGAHPDCSDAHPSYAAAGHDFWLTRNGRGIGFWDRGLGELGQSLTKAAEIYGSVDPYIGDDGRVYF